MTELEEYCEFFKREEQIGALYIMPRASLHYDYLEIYVVPKNLEILQTKATRPYDQMVLVYGELNIINDEVIGWIHEGQWKKDFEDILKSRKDEKSKKELHELAVSRNADKVKKQREQRILDEY